MSPKPSLLEGHRSAQTAVHDRLRPYSTASSSLLLSVDLLTPRILATSRTARPSFKSALGRAQVQLHLGPAAANTVGLGSPQYRDLLTAVEGDSIYIEEYARTMVGQEELHALELQKMLRDFSIPE